MRGLVYSQTALPYTVRFADAIFPRVQHTFTNIRAQVHNVRGKRCVCVYRTTSFFHVERNILYYYGHQENVDRDFFNGILASRSIAARVFAPDVALLSLSLLLYLLKIHSSFSLSSNSVSLRFNDDLLIYSTVESTVR